MPIIDLENPKKADLIHAARQADAFSQLLSSLMLIKNKDVQALLAIWSVAITAGPTAWISYPEGATKILQDEVDSLRKTTPKSVLTKEEKAMIDTMPLKKRKYVKSGKFAKKAKK